MNLLNLLVLGYAFAASIPSNGTLKIDFKKVPTSQLGKRSVGETLNNHATSYVSTLELGSEGTSISFVVDTGSSDLWVDNQAFSGSSTLQTTDEAFEITYGDQSGASGVYATDTVVVGGATLTNAKFGYASTDTTNGLFVWGIGLPAGEADATWDGTNIDPGYDNIPQVLKKQGYISEVAYSLWLDDYDSDTGAILFGGVDHAKYDGTLGKVPVIPTAEGNSNLRVLHPAKPDRLTVKLNSISATNGDGESGTIISGADIPVLLDSGTTLTLLPKTWVTAIGESLGTTWDSNYQAWVVPQSSSPDKPSGSIDYNFSGVEIKTPFESFIRPILTTNGPAYWDDAQQFPVWQLGLDGTTDDVQVGDGTIYILGDTFLAGAYVVFDLDNLEIALAPAKSGTITAENVQAITNGIPSATQAPYYSSTATGSDYSATTLSIF